MDNIEDIILISLLCIPFVALIIYFSNKKDKEREAQFKAKNSQEQKIREDVLAAERSFNFWYNHFVKENGEPTKIIYLDAYNREKLILVFEEKKQIYINGNIYKFESILSCSCTDEAYTVGGDVYETKTDVGAAIGGAIVGGIIAGETGAIIGGLNSPKKTTYHKRNLFHNYTILITIDSIANPTIAINTKTIELANEVISLLQVIISRNK